MNITNQTDIYFSIDDNIELLDKSTIFEYIDLICNKINLMHLDIHKLVDNIYPKLKQINTIDNINEQIVMCASEMVTDHYDYPSIATYILVNALHESTHDDYWNTVQEMYANINRKGDTAPLISESFYKYVEENKDWINEAMMKNYILDFKISLFGFRTFEKAYLKRLSNGKIVERPQQLYMRVAIAIHYRKNDRKRIEETYKLLSEGYYINATPTLFNAGTSHEQLSSCFLLGCEDSMESIGDTWRDTAVISKYAGGIGFCATNIRASGSYINSTQGTASGLSVLNVFNNIGRYANQGGKRNGSIAVYVEPWHGDILYFLDLKKNTGAETERARDLFLALTVNSIFMRRVKEDAVWSLFCPNECPDLLNKYGTEFDNVYEKYETEKKYVRQMSARDLWFKIMESQIETGVPYILYKDHVNEKSNQKNIGTINGSNLCIEIVEYHDANEYAVCNLSSICLPKFVVNGEFDYDNLYEVARTVTRNLDNIIDINFYPVIKAKVSNDANRPIGIGTQGLADVFAMLKIPFESKIAREMNKRIYETIYFGCMTESCLLAEENGYYANYIGSPLEKGQFQFDMWGIDRSTLLWDWNMLMEKIQKYGVRNSLVCSGQPTATSAQLCNNNESFEPYTSNIYTRSTIAGDYYIINKFLMKDLMDTNLWDSNMVDLIKYYEGSIANISNIPDNIKEIYKTVWEIDQKSLIEMSADRGAFIDQSQSLNLFFDQPNFAKLNSAHFYSFEKKLKTGIYYLRSKPKSEPGKFGIDIDMIREIETRNNLKNKEFDIIEEEEVKVCRYRPGTLKEGDICSACT